MLAVHAHVTDRIAVVDVADDDADELESQDGSLSVSVVRALIGLYVTSISQSAAGG